jgi:lipid-binding SYLF domain-containing protein
VSVVLLGALLIGLSGCGAKSPEAVNTAASQMIARSQAHVDQFLNYSQTEGLRNMLGGARGIFVAPSAGGAAFLVGGGSGTGFLMRRHDDDWSDPVFFNLTLVVGGTEIGVKSSRVIMLLMTDTAVDNFINGTSVVGGNGGITVGAFGLSISGAGGPQGGLEVLIISTSQGVSLGGGAATIIPTLAKDLNAQAYGPKMDPKKVLATAGGEYPPAEKLRQDLTNMVRHAWETEKHRPTLAGK